MKAGRPIEFDQSKVLAKILMLFWQKGYERVSMDDLCKLCDLSKPSLYNSFGSKAELFLRCFEAYNEKYIATLLEALTGEADPVRGFEKMLKGAVRQFSNPELPTGCLAITGGLEVKGSSKAIDHRVKQFHEEFVETVEKYFAERAKISASEAARWAEFAIAQFYALAVISRAQPQGLDLNRFVKTAVEAFARMT